MNQINNDKISDKDRVIKIKSELDSAFDSAEQELRELLIEAQKLAKQLKQDKLQI